MISTGSRYCGARLGRRVCDHVIMPGAVISTRMVVPRTVISVPMIVPRAVIDVRLVMPRAVASGLRMIMLVPGRCWFGEWIADVVRY
jgi:hypothetical protein